ncbi:transcriptional regulator PhoB [bacterium BMS3Abin06]|nr:transcriptional regulator PhoB [bacterium BMS3Abin06]
MKTILWVEDEKDQYEAFAYYLEKNYAIDRAIDYEDAVSKFNANKYDLIIVDIIIPSGREAASIEELKRIKDIYFGVELIKKIRAMDQETKILVVTVVKEHFVQLKIHAIDPDIQIINKYDSGPETVRDAVSHLNLNDMKPKHI